MEGGKGGDVQIGVDFDQREVPSYNVANVPVQKHLSMHSSVTPDVLKDRVMAVDASKGIKTLCSKCRTGRYSICLMFPMFPSLSLSFSVSGQWPSLPVPLY